MLGMFMSVIGGFSLLVWTNIEKSQVKSLILKHQSQVYTNVYKRI
jgi:hypothetical protein